MDEGNTGAIAAAVGACADEDAVVEEEVVEVLEGRILVFECNGSRHTPRITRSSRGLDQTLVIKETG